MSRKLVDFIAEAKPGRLIATQTVLYAEDGTPISVVAGVLQTSGGGGSGGAGQSLDTVGFESLMVSTSAVGLTAVGSPTTAIITITGGDIRFRSDGNDPTTLIGHVVFDGGAITLSSAEDIASFRVIRDGGTDATLSISYLVAAS